MLEIEIEYKQLLTEDEYLKLKKYFESKNAILKKQENYYFDNELLTLANEKRMLRIRVKDNSYLLCLKTKRVNDILENNIEVSEQTFNKILDNPNLLNEYYKDLPGDLNLLGVLKTTRLEFSDNGNYCLDKSEYYDCLDYEIEYEALDYESEETFEKFLKNHNIIYDKKFKSKNQRFLKEYEKRKIK